MLIHIARGFTELGEFGVKYGVLNNMNCEFPVDFEPLRSFTPLCDVDIGCHVGVIASSAKGSRVVKCSHEAIFGFHDVVVDNTKVVERNARFGDKNKPFVGNIKQRVREKPSLSITHAHLTPF